MSVQPLLIRHTHARLPLPLFKVLHPRQHDKMQVSACTQQHTTACMAWEACFCRHECGSPSVSGTCFISR